MLKETDEELYKQVKMRMDLQTKSIKTISFYNFLNDGINNLIINCINNKANSDEENSWLINSEDLSNFSFSNFNLENQYKFRLILIVENNFNIKADIKDIETLNTISEKTENSQKNTEENLKENDPYEIYLKNLRNLRNFIKENNNILSIYTINEDNFNTFKAKYPVFFLKETSGKTSPKNSEKISKEISANFQKDKILASSTFPLLIIDNLLYLGNYLNSKNKSQINALGIKSIISLLKEKDYVLKENFKDYFFFESDEINHGNMEFQEILEIVERQIKEKQVPILVYCFSGQTMSVAACIVILMKIKKWSLMLATAYMMKIIPDLKIPAWLNFQLNKFA